MYPLPNFTIYQRKTNWTLLSYSLLESSYLEYLFGCAQSQLQHLGFLVFIVACGIFNCVMRTLSCCMWDLVPGPGIDPAPAPCIENTES